MRRHPDYFIKDNYIVFITYKLHSNVRTYFYLTLPTIIYMVYINHSNVVKKRFFWWGGGERVKYIGKA